MPAVCRVCKRPECALTRGDHYIKWIEDRLRVPEGRDVGKPLIMRPFQQLIIRGVYDATPRPRRVIISMAKKNAKTALSGAILLLNICGPEAARNSQLYSTGQTRKQAATIYRLATKMRKAAPDIAAVTYTRDATKEIICPELGTEFTALARKAESQHGLSPRVVVHDELGQVVTPTWDLYDALETADQAHDDAISFIISTQAPTDNALMSRLMDDAITTSDDPEARPMIVSGDKRTIVFLWTTVEDGHEDDDDWIFTDEAMRQANPAFGDFMSVESMRDKANIAKRIQGNEGVFRNFNLNQRVDAVDPFVPRGLWQACRAAPTQATLESRPNYLALDLSKKTDLTAMAAIAQADDRVWDASVEFWTPSIGIDERSKRDRSPYAQWATEGLIHTTPGRVIDLEIPAARVLEICESREVVVVAFDPHRMDVFIKELARLLGIDTRAEDMLERVLEVVPLKKHGQGFRPMTPAIEAFEEALLDGRIRHGGHPVLQMCAANARAAENATGERMLDKLKSTGRIDGLQALVMAFGAAAMIAPDDNAGPSVYETRGLLEV